jgi:MAF protein
MFHVRPADVDESQRPGEAPRDYVLRLAEKKAKACAASARPGEVVVAADTAVVLDGEILGKPASLAEAVEMLRRLRGRSHQVCTAIAVLENETGALLTDLCVTEVNMRAYTEEEIQTYVLSGDPLDKAGAYAIQHDGFRPVENMQGCYASVMGLPLCHLSRTLAKLDISSRTPLAIQCQSALKYNCPIFARVLTGEDIG